MDNGSGFIELWVNRLFYSFDEDKVSHDINLNLKAIIDQSLNSENDFEEGILVILLNYY